MVDVGDGHDNRSEDETRRQVRAQGRAQKRAAQDEENRRIIEQGRGTVPVFVIHRVSEIPPADLRDRNACGQENSSRERQ
jgi:hypothetical protein